MGIYLNPRNDNFKDVLCAPIYVDKSMMLDVLNRFIDQKIKHICVSRPRRFGKTIAGNMIAAYYAKGAESGCLFSKLKIGKVLGYEEKMGSYHVIHLDVNGIYANTQDAYVRNRGVFCGLTNPMLKLPRRIRAQ